MTYKEKYSVKSVKGKDTEGTMIYVSYGGKVQVNANPSEPIWRPFGHLDRRAKTIEKNHMELMKSNPRIKKLITIIKEE